MKALTRRRSSFLAAVFMAVPLLALAQDTVKFEVAAGYFPEKPGDMPYGPDMIRGPAIDSAARETSRIRPQPTAQAQGV